MYRCDWRFNHTQPLVCDQTTSWIGNRSMKHAFVWAGLIAGLATAACEATTATTSNAPLELLATEHRFASGAWQPASPPATRTLIDLRFWKDGIATEPAPEDVAAVEAAGGRIVHRFHGPMARAELDISAVPGLAWPRGPLNSAATVPDPGAFEIALIVMLDHDLTADDLRAVEALGGRVTHEYHALEGYAVVIDDARVPEVRGLPGVELAGFSAVYCVQTQP